MTPAPTTPASAPTGECDLIMKGGITSGVVYPPAILELKNRYRFRSIGGTSAGAIAAGLTAAAEYGRDQDGFENLQRASTELGQPGFLISLFQPTGGTGPLFRFLLSLLALLSGRRKRLPETVLAVHKGLWEATWIWYVVGFALAGMLGLALAAGAAALFTPAALARALGDFRILALFHLGMIWNLVAGLCLLMAVALLAPIPGLVRLLWILARLVPQNHMGICRGTRATPSSAPALIEWLHEQLQRCAGRTIDDPPLTFGELWAWPGKPPEGQEGKPRIDLRMITSCLSQHQPYALPFTNEVFAVRDEDARQFFPANVTEALLKPRPLRDGQVELPDGFHYLPPAEELPVLVAVRMSLSFPVLFSAVPLYSLPMRPSSGRPGASAAPLKAEQLQLNWFSDGGICSNFPVHFFDRWLPRRPTFGITLTSLPAESFKAGRLSSDYLAMSRPSGQIGGDQPVATPRSRYDDPVYLPRAGDEQAPEWVPLGDPASGGREHPDLFGFLGAVFTTAQSYRDNAQSLLPSYRERVVQIRLQEDEGGLNLNMPEATVQRIVQHGRDAGIVLGKEFDFPEHQWVRYRVLLAELEKNLSHMRGVVSEHRGFWLQELGARAWCADPALRYAYPRPEAWFRTATQRLEQLLAVADSWEGAALFQEAPPAPRPDLRVVPSG